MFIKEKEDQSDFLVNRPQTAFERIKNFPEGVKRLMRDCLQSKAIHDTPLDAWIVDYPDGQQLQIRRIPRRQYQQQRQLRKDFRTMLPLVVIWIPPIIGFLPPILAIVAPRQFMSNHFHNLYELETFAQVEYGQRLRAFSGLADMFLSSVQYDISVQQALAQCLFRVDNHKKDAVGPLLDSLTLYRTVFANNDGVSPRGMFLSVRDLPPEYLVS